MDSNDCASRNRGRGILLRSGLSPGDERPLIEALVNDALSDLGRLPLGRDGLPSADRARLRRLVEA